MRKIFNKVFAGVMATTMVATLAIGLNVNSKEVKAEVANAITSNWVNAAPSWEPNDAVIANSTFTSTPDSISANISITGWQAMWREDPDTPAPDDALLLEKTWGDKPYQITSTNTAKIVPGNTYKLKFTVENKMMVADTQTPTEKNITIKVSSGVEGDNDNEFLFKTVTVPAGSTQTYDFDIPISEDYQKDDVQVQFAYGSYSYSYDLTQAVKNGTFTEEAAKACKYAYAYGTTEKVNAHGTLNFKDISLMGEKYTSSVIPSKETTVQETTTTTVKKPDTSKPSTPVAKKFAKVKKLKVVSKKKGVVKISWRKVRYAKKYQIKVGKKTYNTSKVKYTVRKLKKGKVVVKVRVKAANGYKASAWVTKRVKVK